jgi:putative hemolysin
MSMQAAGFAASWARHADEVRQAQRLRHDVFALEMGAQLRTPLAGHDIDPFDEFCDHLLVRERGSGTVIGTYRVLTPSQSRRAGGSHAATEFDLRPLARLRPRMAELGRSCVHPDHRHGGVVLALWRALALFMAVQGLDTLIGCASVPLQPGPSSIAERSRGAAGVWQQVRQAHLADPALRVRPLHPLPLPPEAELATLQAAPPPLIRAYLRIGARVLGPPAWDADFHTADLPMLVRVADLPARYRAAA